MWTDEVVCGRNARLARLIVVGKRQATLAADHTAAEVEEEQTAADRSAALGAVRQAETITRQPAERLCLEGLTGRRQKRRPACSKCRLRTYSLPARKTSGMTTVTSWPVVGARRKGASGLSKLTGMVCGASSLGRVRVSSIPSCACANCRRRRPGGASWSLIWLRPSRARAAAPRIPPTRAAEQQELRKPMLRVVDAMSSGGFSEA